MPRHFLSVALLLLLSGSAFAAEPPSGNAFLDFVREQAAILRASDRAPANLEDWQQRKALIRRELLSSWGGFPEQKAPLEPTIHGELKRDGYRVEKVTFQTFPGVRMTANAYVPSTPGKHPAILCVHGHWKGAKQDPVVQSRCIGAVKLGFFVLCVDAFGAGERGLGKALGEYHGEMVAATLFPLGRPLSGLQVYENMRAVDYLQTRPEVDGANIGITGASGGGNQTMYAGAFDERFKAVVPVCSVGNYQAYLGAACCMCEVVPGALHFTEEKDILALVAPRGLMVVNATRDAKQFSVDEAKKSIAGVTPVFQLFKKPDNIKHAVFESPHDYNKAMREMMYGWMTKQLKGKGDGSPIPEPAFQTENPEDLRIYPGNTRPDDWLTLPQFAAREAKKLLASRATSNTKTLSRLYWSKLDRETSPLTIDKGVQPDFSVTGKGDKTILLLTCEDEKGSKLPSVTSLADSTKAKIVRLNLRATGKQGWKSDQVGRAPDHNTAEWSLWLGRPLLEQWVLDLRKTLQESGTRDVAVLAEGSAGVVAMLAAVIDDRVSSVTTTGTLASYVTDVPYVGTRLGILSPGILTTVGDIPHIAAAMAPKKLVILGGVDGGGKKLDNVAMKSLFDPAFKAYKAVNASGKLVVSADAPAKLESYLNSKAIAKPAIFARGATLKVEAEGDGAGEGPAWDPELGILTSGHNTHINRLALDGKQSIYREKANSNGLLFDRDGSLLVCEPVNRRVSRISRDGKLKVLTDSYEGKKYNQPNDITVDSQGRIYFSDPRYGPRDDMQQRDASGKTIEGVYRIDPDGKVTRILGREVDRANGVLVSADDRFLFVADNNNDLGGARKLLRFDLKKDGTVDLKSKKVLHDWKLDRGPDGLKQDSQGRLYVAGGLNKPNPPAEPGPGRGGVTVIDPYSGEVLAFLAVPRDEVTNCAFGGKDLKTLYITGGGTLYSIRTTTSGRVIWPK